MKIELTTPDSPYKTIIDTEHNVTIANSYIGPILTHLGVCVSVFARDDGFEMNVWRGTPDHNEPLPAGALMLSVHPERGVTVLNDGSSDGDA